MPVALVILAGVLNGIALATLVYWTVGLARLLATKLLLPTARHGVGMAAGMPHWPAVSVIIPAHNEEASIGPLVRSLLAQDYPNFSVVLCLDRCTDSTAELIGTLARGDGRFHAIEIDHCPDGWAGKVNAVFTGVRSEWARGADLLLFADADTVFDPACVTATVALLENRGLDLLSLLSTLTCRQWFEYLVQPAAGLELVRQYPMLRANRRRGRRRAFANGQFMLFRREAYDAIGGHEAVKDELLEDLALARNMADAGRPAGLFLADGMLTCRMYESWQAFRNGWKRIYIESAKCKVGRLRKAAAASALMGGVFPALTLVNLFFALEFLLPNEAGRSWGTASAVLSGLGLLAWVLVVAATHRIGRVPLWAVPGFAIGAWLVGVIEWEAARDLRKGIATRWAGRDYIRRPR